MVFESMALFWLGERVYGWTNGGVRPDTPALGSLISKDKTLTDDDGTYLAARCTSSFPEDASQRDGG